MSILGSMSDALRKQPKAPTISPTPEKDNSQTMAGNVANILNGNSLLMNSAAAKGERIAANRGLQNSTIGAEAAQRAMLDAAMPIASQDTQNAFTEKQTRLQADLNYQNQSRLNQAQNQFTASQTALDRSHQRGMAQLQADLSYKNQSRLNDIQNKFTASQADLDRGHQRGLAQLQADLSYKNQSRLNDIQNKFTASQAELDRSHQRGMAQLQSDLNYSNQSRLNQAQNQFAASQAELDRGHQRSLAQLQSDLNYNNQSRLAKLQSDLNFNNQSRLNQEQNKFTASQTALDRSHQRDLANLNHANEMKNLNAQVSANTIGKSIDFTMQITNNFDAQIAAVLNNTAMKAEDKQKAITELKASRDSELNFMSKFMQGIPTTKQNWASFPNLGVPTIGIK